MLSRRLLFRLAQAITGMVLGLLMGWLGVRGLDWGLIRSTIAGLAPAPLGLAVATFLLGIYLRAVRWRLLLVRQRISVRRLFLVQNAGIGLNSVSPVRALSEPTQFGILTLHDHLAPGAVLATMAVERAMDLLVNVVIISAGIVLLSALAPFSPYVAAGAIASLIGIGLFFVVGLGLGKSAIGKRVPLTWDFDDTLRALRSDRLTSLAALAASFIYWGLVGSCGWLLGVGLDAQLDWFTAIVLVQASVLFSTSVPGLPGAFGTFEFAAASLLGLAGATPEVAIAWALALHLLLFVPSVLIAAVVLPREGVASVGALRTLMERWRATA